MLAVEKLVHSKLLVPGSGRRIGSADLHAGIASAGLLADGRQLLNRAREEAKSYRSLLDQPIPAKILAERVSLFMQAYTLYSSVRPFGATVLLACQSIEGPQLYMIEPSGSYWGYHGAAIGKGKQVARTEIEKLNLKDMDVLEAIKHAARIIYAAHDEAKDKQFELEMSWISPQSNGRHEPVPKALLAEAEAYAKEMILEEMQD